MVSSSSSLKEDCNLVKQTVRFDSLPDELVLVEIIGRVAVSSLTDICNIKLVSKYLQDLSNDPYVFQNVSLDRVPVIPWRKNPETSSFLKKCRNNGNAEALYRKGIVNYFGLGHSKRKGLEYLAKAAAAKTHREAMYLQGMIATCTKGEEKVKGYEILSSLVKSSMSKTMRNLEECREKIRADIRCMWIDKSFIRQLQDSPHTYEKCKCKGETTRFLVRNSVWNRYGEDNDRNCCVCETCLWSHEIKNFFDIF